MDASKCQKLYLKKYSTYAYVKYHCKVYLLEELTFSGYTFIKNQVHIHNTLHTQSN